MRKPTRKNPVIMPLQARSQMTFDAIKEATTYLLEENGVERITSNEIVDKAGVNINSFYRYFYDKHAVLNLLAEEQVRNNCVALKKLIEQARNMLIEERFIWVIREITALFSENYQYRRELLFHMSHIIGVKRQFEVRAEITEILAPIIPGIIYRTPTEKYRAAQILVQSFMANTVIFLNPEYTQTERRKQQAEVVNLVIRFVGLKG